MKKNILSILLLSFVIFEAQAVCNWKSNIKQFAAVVLDSCPNKHFYGGISLISSKGITYNWTIGSSVISTSSNFNFTPSANGYYTICLKLTDTVNKCDTIVCSKSLWYNCYTTCNWKGRYPTFKTWDTCRGKGGINNLNGSISFNNNTSCFKYSWSINNVSVGNGKTIKYAITGNGTYDICVKVTDTCNKCDTTFCDTKTITCFSNPCNWEKITSNFYTWDSCRGSGYKNSINGYLAFNTKGCFKYAWTVNGVATGTGSVNQYHITQNGTYTYCVKVTDTCNKCDTTFCETKKISCFSTPCKWYLRKPVMGVWDSCVSAGAKNNKVNAYISFNNNATCYKYQWTVNNNIAAGNNYIMNKGITANGTYTICVKITDTCVKCDTTICKNITVNCLPSPCNWTNRGAQFSVWDSWKTINGKSSVNGYINFSTKCMKYEWKINNTYAGNGNNMSQLITQNGTYTICVNVTDTCNKCDTTYCATKTINCFTQKCNWKGRYPTFTTFDSCKGYKGKTNSIGAYVSFNSNSSCFKYQWTINNSPISSPFNVIVNPLFQNGSYNICVKVTDTCNKCDTTFCATRTITCFTSKCNWKNRITCFEAKDSCAGKYLFGKVCLATNNTTGCIKKQWTVGGSVIGTGNDIRYNLTKNGSYVVCLKLTDTCNKCDTTLCKTILVNCNNLKVSTIGDYSNLVKVYPNPANELLTIEWLSDIKCSYQILNTVGSVVLNGDVINGSNTINTSTLNNTMYIIKLNSTEGIQSIKIFINR